MADDFKVRLRIGGLNRVMRAAQPELDRVGRQLASRAGDGFEYEADPHKWTARGYVQTKNARGRRREAIEKVLVRLVGGV